MAYNLKIKYKCFLKLSSDGCKIVITTIRMIKNKCYKWVNDCKPNNCLLN